MPVKRDARGQRWVEMELVVPGTPEDVWRAMATGPGNSAWFTKATIDEHVGGAIRFDMGPDGTSAGEVTAWEPPHRFGYVERDWMAGAPPVATEITVTARSGDRCVVRMVHSLVATSDDWDDQLEGFEQGWPAFFDVLRAYLAHFAGETATPLMARVHTSHGPLHAWTRLTEALGLAGANVGETRSATAGPEPFSGVLETTRQTEAHRMALLRLDAPARGLALVAAYDWGGRTHASVTLFLYDPAAGDGTHVRGALWQDWLTSRFAADSPAG